MLFSLPKFLWKFLKIILLLFAMFLCWLVPGHSYLGEAITQCGCICKKCKRCPRRRTTVFCSKHDPRRTCY